MDLDWKAKKTNDEMPQDIAGRHGTHDAIWRETKNDFATCVHHQKQQTQSETITLILRQWHRRLKGAIKWQATVSRERSQTLERHCPYFAIVKKTSTTLQLKRNNSGPLTTSQHKTSCTTMYEKLPCETCSLWITNKTITEKRNIIKLQCVAIINRLQKL